ncbi:MAG TPA: hypothetical protein VFW23_12355 [Tepidisphaeraceae bacterium]|nr:hypothetical protein [Tepidisphaeraceae bacterium]
MSKAMVGEDVEELPGALDLDPGLPRLIGCGPGRLSFTQYNNWRLRRGEKCVAVEPVVATLRQWEWFLAISVLLVAAAEYATWRLMAPGDIRLFLMVGIPFSFVSLLIGAAVNQWIGQSAAAKGVIFRYSADDAILHLPQINRTVPRNQIARLDLISGTWIRDLDSRGEHLFDVGTELHAVVRLKNGSLVSLPLLGMGGKVWKLNRRLDQTARALSEASGLLLERIEESTTFRDPYAKIRKRIEGGKCPICSYDLTGNTSGACPECGTPVPHGAGDSARGAKQV